MLFILSNVTKTFARKSRTFEFLASSLPASHDITNQATSAIVKSDGQLHQDRRIFKMRMNTGVMSGIEISPRIMIENVVCRGRGRFLFDNVQRSSGQCRWQNFFSVVERSVGGSTFSVVTAHTKEIARRSKSQTQQLRKARRRARKTARVGGGKPGQQFGS